MSDGRTVVLGGATARTGEAVLRAFLAAGYRVLATSRPDLVEVGDLELAGLPVTRVRRQHEVSAQMAAERFPVGGSRQ